MNHGSYSGQIHMYTDTQMEIIILRHLYLLIVLAVNIVQLWINGTIGSKKGE